MAVPIVNKSDNRLAIVAAIVYALIVAFLLYFITYSIADPPKITIPLPVQMGAIGITDFKVDNGGGGSPAPNVTPTPQPENNPKEQPTQEKSPITVPTGTGESDTKGQVTQTPSAPNPFSGNSNGGSGTSGTGNGFGSDSGPGSGSGNPGIGGGGNRDLLTHSISKPNTVNDETGIVAFYLTVDARGAVLRADVDRKKTTINNQRLIDEIKGIVKEEVHFNKQPGAKLVKIYYTVKVRPN